MSQLFLKILNMSISASYIVLAVLLLRTFFKKAPKWISVVLWGIVGIRLISPFSIESILSLIPSAETFAPTIMTDNVPAINSGIPILNSTINPIIGESLAPNPGDSINPLQIWIPILTAIWLIGVFAFIIYTLVSYLRLKNMIGTAVLYSDNIYQSENVSSPFVLGIVRPKIYLPFKISDGDISHVIAHEKAHIHRRDHLWKPLGFLLLSLHWFNPLMWIAYILLCRDIELACDEKVIKELDKSERADYSQALLSCSVNRRIIAACPLAFGEVSVKNRVKSVLNYRRPAFWLIVLALIVCVFTAISFLTDPAKAKGIGAQTGISGLDGVSLKIISTELSAPDPFLEIEWRNETENEILFGEAFTLFRYENGIPENCTLNENFDWTLSACLLSPSQTLTHKYKLNGHIMTQPGKYRFETKYTFAGKPDSEYTAWIDFESKKSVDVMKVHVFDPVALVYNDGIYSFVQTSEHAPDYLIVNDMCLLERRQGVVSDGIGRFTEIDLTEETFDSRFRDTTHSWIEKDSFNALKKNNKRMWQFYHESSLGTFELYILLEQKDGTFYLGYGYYNSNSNSPANPDDSHIRWLYRLKEISGNNDLSLNGSADTENTDLREKYPYFFGIDDSDGLTVYIWQLAPEHYRCYLVSTAMDRISDMSFAFTGGASVKEMREILSMYGIPKNKVTLKPVINPISSMHYVIDDTYRENINKLFWSDEYAPSGNIGEASSLSYEIERTQERIAELKALANESNENIKKLEAAIKHENDKGTFSNNELLNQLTNKLSLEREAVDQIYKQLNAEKEYSDILKEHLEYVREETYTNIIFNYEGEHTFFDPQYYNTYRNEKNDMDKGYKYYHIAFRKCHDCGEVFESEPFGCGYNSATCSGGCVEHFQ
ncbi:MAG: hypothetical protein E7665_04380 [Ruminococcaceae bacterium]|nr:hypothetical protein [Oscillospiraceae bacterium]